MEQYIHGIPTTHRNGKPEITEDSSITGVQDDVTGPENDNGIL